MRHRRTLVPLVTTALALAASTPGYAATLMAAAQTWSWQGQSLSGGSAVQTLPTLQVTLGADYAPFDEVIVRVGGAVVGGDTDANLVGAAAITCSGGPALVLSFVGRTGNDIRLRVTQKNVLNTAGVTCTIQGIDVTSSSLMPGAPVTIGWRASAAATSLPFDPTGPIAVAEVIDQFATRSSVPLDGVVDVDEPSRRREFVSDDGAAFALTEDSLRLTTHDRRAEVSAGPIALLETIVVEVSGDFSFADNDGNGCSLADLGVGAGQVAATATGDGTGVLTVAPDCQTVTWAYAPPQVAPFAELVTHTLTFGKTAPGGQPITAPQRFSGSVRYEYALGVAAGEESDSRLALGAWDVNGFLAFVPYMPYAAGISQIIYLTSRSAQSAAVTVDAYNQSSVSCSFSTGPIEGGRVTILTGAVRAGLERCYGADFSDRISMTVAAVIPGGRAELVTAYNVDGNRVQVTNSSNGRVTQAGSSASGGGL
jgi:hypothetical protein